MTAIGGTTSATIASSAQETQSLNMVQFLQALSSLSGSGGVESTAGLGLQSSSNISGLGQLFSNLNVLASQSTSSFQQVATQIAGALQTASQQATGSASQFLSTLSNTLEQAAATGAMPDIQQHHQAQHAQGYNSAGLPTQASSGTGATANLQQLFVSLAQQVGAAITV